MAELKRHPELLALALYATKVRGVGAGVAVGSRNAQPSQRSEEVPELGDIDLTLGPAWTQGTVSCRLDSSSPFVYGGKF